MIDEALSKQLQATLWPFGVGAIGVAYFAAPELKFADPVMLGTFGVFAAVTFILMCWSFVVQTPSWASVLAKIFVSMLLISNGMFLVWITAQAEDNSRASDRRCLAIQTDMLSAYPLRSDDAEVFQALGCRSQGEGSVMVSRAAVRERVTHYRH